MVWDGSLIELPVFLKLVFIIHLLQLTRLYLGFAVIHPKGFSIDAGLLLPYCWSIKLEQINAQRSFVVNVGAGEFTSLTNPLPYCTEMNV